jgi:hypothetical protein
VCHEKIIIVARGPDDAACPVRVKGMLCFYQMQIR